MKAYSRSSANSGAASGLALAKVRRLGRFAWRLMREPLRALVGVAGGLAILFFAWGIGHLCGFGIEALGAGIAILVLGAVTLMFAILGIVAIAALCGKVRDAWEESA